MLSLYFYIVGGRMTNRRLTPLGVVLRNYRIYQGMKQITMANALNTSDAYLSAVELGTSKPSVPFTASVYKYMIEQMQMPESEVISILSKTIGKVSIEREHVVPEDWESIVRIYIRQLV